LGQVLGYLFVIFVSSAACAEYSGHSRIVAGKKSFTIFVAITRFTHSVFRAPVKFKKKKGKWPLAGCLRSKVVREENKMIKPTTDNREQLESHCKSN
jgi:hypothetical protein